VALLAGIEKIVASSKKREESEKIGKDLRGLVRDLIDLTKLHEEASVQLEAKCKEVDIFKKKEKAVEAKERALDELKENANEDRDAQKESRKEREEAVQSLVEANQRNSEAISKWVAAYHKKDHELELSKQKVEGMAEVRKSDKKIFEKEKQELQDKIRDLEIELARNPRLDVATEQSETAEELKKLQDKKEHLIQERATNDEKTKDHKESISQREKDVRKKGLGDTEKGLFDQLLGIAKTNLADHQKKCEKLQEDLRECEDDIRKEHQRQNSVGSSSSGGNSQWSADTGASTNTTLTRCISCSREIGPKEVAEAGK
jgi:hypothetical protein